MFWIFLTLALSIYFLLCFVIQAFAYFVEIKRDRYVKSTSLTLVGILMSISIAAFVTLLI